MFICRYTKSYDSKKAYMWRCVHRGASKGVGSCDATVRQSRIEGKDREDYDQTDFQVQRHSTWAAHSHPPTAGKEIQMAIYRDAKDICMKKEKRFMSTCDIAYQVLESYKSTPGSYLPHFLNFCRVINAFRSSARPPNPAKDNLFFPVQTSFFPTNIFRGEVWPSDRQARHLIFATDLQLRKLTRCQQWYMDGTFKLVSRPFIQLFTMNGFLVNDKGKLKSLMIDYKLILL